MECFLERLVEAVYQDHPLGNIDLSSEFSRFGRGSLGSFVESARCGKFLSIRARGRQKIEVVAVHDNEAAFKDI
jgi:hypothetical protein